MSIRIQKTMYLNIFIRILDMFVNSSTTTEGSFRKTCIYFRLICNRYAFLVTVLVYIGGFFL